MKHLYTSYSPASLWAVRHHYTSGSSKSYCTAWERCRMNQAVQVCIGVAKNCKLLLTVNCHTVSVVTDTSTLLYSPALDLLRRVESLWKRIVFTRSFVLLWPPNRAGHYILPLWFLPFIYFSSVLSGRRLDVYHTSTHDAALVRI